MIPKPQDAIWNDQQWKAIHAKSQEILVSAGAGSGKTAVLVERIIQKMTRDQVNIDELLVLTFTEAAAAEMKGRIRLRLEAEPANEHLAKQLNKLAWARISTFHAFCYQLIQKYYYLLGLDPAFKIADDIEISLIQDEVLESLLDDLNEQEDAAFLLLNDSFSSDRSDEALKVMLLKVYELARSNPQMFEWLGQLSELYSWDHQDLGSWRYYDELLQLVTLALDEAKHHLEQAKTLAVAPHKYAAEVYPEDQAYLERLLQPDLSYEQLRAVIINTKLATFPRLDKKNFDEDLHLKIKAARDAFKKQIEQIKKQFFAYSNQTHQLHFAQSTRVIHALSQVVLQFHERFIKAKQEKLRLDFSDLEWNTLKLLLENGEPTEVAKSLHQQFKEIMIDEYQDTNSMQERIVNGISKVAAPKVPIFMVGDVKQSIYRFRLAEPSIFQGKDQAFSDDQALGLKIDLMENYRSNRQVIEGTNELFKQLMDKTVGEISYDASAMLKLGIKNEEADDFGQGELHLIDKKQFDEDEDVASLEAHHLARTILNWVEEGQLLYDRKQGEYRRVQYQDIVILMRSLTHVTTFQDVFRTYNIPLFTEQNTDLFDCVEVINVLSCLKVIDNPDQDIPLVGLMRSPLFFFTEKELAMIKVEGNGHSFYDRVLQYESLGTATFLKEKVSAFIKKISRWRYDSKILPLAKLISLIYEQTHYYEFVLGLPHGPLRKANLDVFLDRARSYEASTKKGLYGFINYIERMQALGKHFGRAKTTTASVDVVRIMSIHKSKGLEFPIVFMSQIHKRFNQQDEFGNYIMHKKYGVAVKYIDPSLRLRQKTIAGSLVGTLIHQEMLAEEMRLLYVSMTRAKSKIIFTGVLDLEKKLPAFADVIAGPEGLLPISFRLKAKSYGDWVIPAIYRSDPERWRVLTITEYEAMSSPKEVEKKVTLKAPDLDIEKIFTRSYEFEHLLSISAKQSVSQRKVEEGTTLFKGIPEARPQVVYDRPAFMKEKQVTGAERGTALHHFMQHLPVAASYTLEDLASLRADLIRQEVIEETLALSINLKKVWAFTKSALYGELLKAKQIKKEAPFMTLVKVDEDEASQILLQGVIDLLAEFAAEVWIIDYKTDYVKDFEQELPKLRERYSVQMKYYGKAIKEIYPNKKVLCYVYFLNPQRYIVYE